MSKQDIEKRLGFAAQGVKETTRLRAKTRMKRPPLVWKSETHTGLNGKKYTNYSAPVQEGVTAMIFPQWLSAVVDGNKVTTKDEGVHLVINGYKFKYDSVESAKAGAEDRIARNAGVYLDYYARPGVKAKFVRIVTTPQGRYTTNLDKNTRAPIEGGKGYVMVDPAMYITPKRVRVQGTKGEIEVRAIVEGKEIVGVSAKLVSARPGAKAEMAIRAGNLVKFKYIVAPGDKEFRGKVVRIEGKYAIVDFGITTPAYQEWVQPGQMTRRILVDELVTASRPGVKAKMAFTSFEIVITDESGKKKYKKVASFDEGFRQLKALPSSVTDAVLMEHMGDMNTMLAQRYGSSTVLTAQGKDRKRSTAARPGVKAKMSATFIVAEAIFNAENAVRRGDNENARRWIKAAQDAMDETVVSTGMRSKLEQLVKRYKMSRSGVKAKFDTKVGSKGNKSAMIAKNGPDADASWLAWVVQHHGEGQGESVLGTMRSYSTEARAKAAALRGLETSGLRGGFSRPGVKAKA